MLEFRVCGVPCRVSLLFPALLTALLLCQTDTLTVWCLLASVIHEGGHLLGMLLLRIPPQECVLGVFGARIRLGRNLKHYGRNIGVALAGPLANAVSAGLLFWLGASRAAWVHILLALLNLLPVAVLDGGEILRCLLCLFGRECRQESVVKWVSTILLLPVMGGGGLLLLQGNPTLLIVGLYLVAMTYFSDKNEKSS